MLNIAEDLHNNSKAVSIIGTAIYMSTFDSPVPFISTPGTKEIFDGIYFIENVTIQRYVFQDGNPNKGKRGA